MSTHHTRVPALLLLLAAAMLIAAITGCERKVEGTVAVEETVSDQCFDCHKGQIDTQQGEWAHSVHASGENIDYTSRPGGSCNECHNQDGFIEFLASGTLISAGNAKAIGCFACHNPHETGNFDRRTEAPYTLVTGDVYDVGTSNLCVNCHHSRTDQTAITDNFTITSSRFGPHYGPQGDLLNGTAGYEGFPGFAKTETLHRSILSDGCVSCHMSWARAHAGYEIGGHSMNMHDEAGNDLTANCQDAACHGGGALEFDDAVSGEPYDFILLSAGGSGYQTQIDSLRDTLVILLDVKGGGIYNPSTGRNNTGTYADGHIVGAYWNWKMIGEDHSHGIHNFEYAKALLEASMAYLEGLP